MTLCVLILRRRYIWFCLQALPKTATLRLSEHTHTHTHGIEAIRHSKNDKQYSILSNSNADNSNEPFNIVAVYTVRLIRCGCVRGWVCFSMNRKFCHEKWRIKVCGGDLSSCRLSGLGGQCQRYTHTNIAHRWAIAMCQCCSLAGAAESMHRFLSSSAYGRESEKDSG